MANFRLERSTDVDALVRNAAAIKTAAGGRKLIAVVKANAYGNGLVQCARALEGEASMFAVSAVSEAQALVRNKIKAPVLILGTLTKSDKRLAARLKGVVQSVSSLAEAACLDELARELSVTVPVHIAVDSGMHRFGFDPDPRLMGLVATFRHLRIEGIYTHYARAGYDEDFTDRQRSQFCDVADALTRRGTTFCYVHAAASAAVSSGKGICGNAVRVGLSLYGEGEGRGLVPVATVVARVLVLRTLERGESTGYGDGFVAPTRMRIAIASAGYADGVPLSLSGRGVVLVAGVRCRMVGTVCMDVFACDVSAVHGVSEGDAVTVVGRDGSAFVGLAEQASLAGTSVYELSTRLACRKR